MPEASQIDDRLPDVAAPDADHQWPFLLRHKVFPRLSPATDEFHRGVAVVQENDAVVLQVPHGALDVAHHLLVGVQPVDQRDVNRALREEGRLLGEEGVAGGLEVVGDASFAVGQSRGCARTA